MTCSDFDSASLKIALLQSFFSIKIYYLKKMYHFIIRFIFKLFIKKDNINKIKKYDTNKFNTRINIILILRDKTKKS